MFLTKTKLLYKLFFFLLFLGLGFLSQAQSSKTTETTSTLSSDKVSTITMSSIKEALTEKGYFTGRIDNIFDAAFKKALIAFQKDHDLTTGNIDEDTIIALGLKERN